MISVSSGHLAGKLLAALYSRRSARPSSIAAVSSDYAQYRYGLLTAVGGLSLDILRTDVNFTMIMDTALGGEAHIWLRDLKVSIL